MSPGARAEVSVSRGDGESSPVPVVCLAGNPNVGKSSLFNALTGARAETAHCAGVTTEACTVRTRWRGRRLDVVDIPGAYSLDARNGDELAAQTALLERRPDLVVAVVDATNLARSLYLPLQLLDFGFDVVLAVNLVDEARRRQRPVDVAALERALGVPVVATVAPRGEGIDALERVVLAAVDDEAKAGAAGAGPGVPQGTPLPVAVEQRLRALSAAISAQSAATLPTETVSAQSSTTPLPTAPASAQRSAPRPPTAGAQPATTVAASLTLRARALAVLEGYDDGAPLLAGVLTPADDELTLQISQARHAEARRIAALAQAAAATSLSDRIWVRATTPATGIPLLIAVLVGLFATLFVVGDLLARLLTALWSGVVSPWVTSGVTALFGAGALGRIVLWGVDGGVLATLAVGIPYILTFYFLLALIEDTGYMNAAAFLSDRVMHRFGLHGRAVIPLIAAGGCNVPAVIATRTLSSPRERFIAATLATLTPCSARSAVIIGAVAGVAGWQYAVLVYALLFVVIVAAGLVLNRFVPGTETAFIMELFPFRRPVMRQVGRKTWRRFREFVWDAAPIIILGSMALGLLYETGIIWWFTKPLAPIVEGWLALPAVAGLTLIFAVLRKELALQLLLVFATVSAGSAVASIGSIMSTSQIVTYALVNAIYIPCLATIAVLGRELGWRRTLIICVATIVVALLAGGVVARGAALLS